MSAGQLYHRQPGETAKAYEAFVIYRDMPVQGRSQQAVADQLGKSPTLISRWASRWDWSVRAAAYDSMLETRLMAVRHRELEKGEARWAQRRQAQRDREWDISERLMERAEQMLAMPLTRQRVVRDGDQMITIIEPVQWTHRDIVRFVETSTKMARLSANMGTTTEDMRTAVLTQVRRMARNHGLDVAEAVERAERLLSERVYLPDEDEVEVGVHGE